MNSRSSKKATSKARRNKGYNFVKTTIVATSPPSAYELLVERHQEYCFEPTEDLEVAIRADVKALTESILAVRPQDMLEFARQNYQKANSKSYSEIDTTLADVLALRLLEYTQAVYAASPPQQHPQPISEEAKRRVANLIKNLSALTCRLTVARGIQGKLGDVSLSESGRVLLIETCISWLQIRKKRHSALDIPYLTMMIRSQDATFQEAFSISSSAIISGYEKLIDVLLRGLNARGDFLHEMWLELQSVPDDGLGSIMEAHRRRFTAEFSEEGTLEHYDVEKITGWPIAFIRQLTWHQGEESKFFDDSEYSGWLTQVLPFRQRPFIGVEGRSFCLDLAALTDYFYSALQKALRRERPDLAKNWNSGQNVISEELSAELLQKVLPGAVAYSSLHYPLITSWKKVTEVDNLIVYGDVLFVVEVKAPSFTPSSPYQKFNEFLHSYEKLVVEPAGQCKRFIDYLNSADEVLLKSKDKTGKLVECLTLRARDFRLIVPMGVTVENFTQLAAQAELLRTFGQELPLRTFWSISLDDLMAVTEILSSPAVFLQYAEQRLECSTCETLRFVDELDHLGQYLSNVNYAKDTRKDTGRLPVPKVGLTREIDRYFSGQMRETNPRKPRPMLAPDVHALLHALQASATPGWLELARDILRAGDSIAKPLRAAIKRSFRNKAPSDNFAQFLYGASLTVVVLRDDGLPSPTASSNAEPSVKTTSGRILEIFVDSKREIQSAVVKYL